MTASAPTSSWPSPWAGLFIAVFGVFLATLQVVELRTAWALQGRGVPVEAFVTHIVDDSFSESGSVHIHLAWMADNPSKVGALVPVSRYTGSVNLAVWPGSLPAEGDTVRVRILPDAPAVVGPDAGFWATFWRPAVAGAGLMAAVFIVGGVVIVGVGLWERRGG